MWRSAALAHGRSIDSLFPKRSIILGAREELPAVPACTAERSKKTVAQGSNGAGGGQGGRHRAHVGTWLRLQLAVGGLFHSQQRKCRTGHHHFTESTPIGGGIVRQTCSGCQAVSLDLREATDATAPQLFTKKSELETFAILRRQVFEND